MAPQFRSRGVGYLRLGDDMSRFGTAFLSLDAGHSFLGPGGAAPPQSIDACSNLTDARRERSNGGSQAAPSGIGVGGAANTRKGPIRAGARSKFASTMKEVPRGGIASLPSTAPLLTSSQQAIEKFDPAEGSNGGGDEDSVGGQGYCDEEAGGRERTGSGAEGVREALVALRVEALKWTERATALAELKSCAPPALALQTSTANATTPSIDSSLLVEVLSVLSDHLAQQKNPNVVKGTIGCVGAWGPFVDACITNGRVENTCALIWNGLVLEVQSRDRLVSHTVCACALAPPLAFLMWRFCIVSLIRRFLLWSIIACVSLCLCGAGRVPHTHRPL